jgi:prepilin-type N-terminal cleavage/methylation domain-containing protein
MIPCTKSPAQRGFTWIEMLASVVIIAFGLMGVAGLLFNGV